MTFQCDIVDILVLTLVTVFMKQTVDKRSHALMAIQINNIVDER